MRAFCVCMEQFESRVLLAAGAVDPSYSTYRDYRSMVSAWGSEVHAQLDGKMLHYVPWWSSEGGPELYRTNPNGTDDSSFGSSGRFPIDFDLLEFKVASDGKIVALASSDGSSLELHRYTANGAPDSSFGVGGKVVSTPSGIYYDMALQNDGKILLIGSDSTNGYVRRYNTNGTLDSSFGSGGIVTIKPRYSMGLGWVNMGSIDIRRSDNRIVVSATDLVKGGGELAELFILAPNGAIEWQTEGAPMSNDGSTGGQVVVDGDGSILETGSALFYDASNDYSYHNFLVRYPAPKSTAAVNWIVRGDFEGGIIPQVDGRILTTIDHQIIRRNYDFTRDYSFGSGGAVNVDLDSFTMALQGDGKIVVDGGKQTIPEHSDADHYSFRLTGDSPAVTLGSDGSLNLFGSARGDRIVASSGGGIVTVFNNATGPFPFTASAVKKIQANSGDGNDAILLSGPLPASILNGGNGNDTLTGADGADTLNGGLGNDIFKGGNNRDTVTYAGRSSAVLLSIDNSANDGQTGEFDNIATDIETVIGGNGNDRITGSDATNALYGGPGNDLLIGKGGNDLLGGQDGNDTMDGGAGSDGFFGNAGIDTADYSNRWDALIITQDEISNDGKAGEYDNVHNDVEVIKGGNLADKITGGSMNNTLYGLGGNDTLIGGGGNDVIYGGAGNDQLTGSAGADSLFGEDGDDTLFARDGVADLLLNGGNGIDSAQVDSSDANRASIEKYLA